MMTGIKKNTYLLSLFLCFFFFSLTAKAGSASLSLNGANTVYVNNKIEITLAISNLSDVNGGIQSVGAKLNYDASALEYVSATPLAVISMSYVDQSKRIAGLGMGSNVMGNSNLIKLVFTAKKIGPTTISLSSSELSDGTGTSVGTNNPTKTITITPPPSTNANLSSITLSSGSINFNSATTSYNVAVGGDVTSINIGASVEDAGAKVSGTGTKSLSYGKNNFSLVVTAASGDKKTYTIIVNREDNRSNVNTLKSLSVTNYNINPSFNANTTSYNISVPFDVSQVSVSAAATDDKASVKVGNTKLAAGKITNITITVTAENGSTKTYTIKAKRESDPNKVLATDNNLASLTVSTGTFSPAFNKETTEYSMTVPFETEEITVTGKPSDAKYGDVDITGPEKLSVGENKFQIKVTAEDSSTKTYTLIVTREQDPNAPVEIDPNEGPEEPTESLNLKSLTITNGSLKEEFNTSIHLYHYKKGTDLKIEAIAEDEENSVTVLEYDGVYTIIIENEEKEREVYTLVPESSNTIPIVIIVISTILIGSGSTVGYLVGAKKITMFSKKKIDKKSKTKTIKPKTK